MGQGLFMEINVTDTKKLNGARSVYGNKCYRYEKTQQPWINRNLPIRRLIMTKKEKQKYQVREEACYNRDCFVPFSGNGVKICRLYEMGRCPKNITGRLGNKNEKTCKKSDK